jgi:hypothetical protein
MLHGGLVDTRLFHMEVWWIQVYVTWKFGGYRFMSHGGLVDTGLCQSHGSFGVIRRSNANIMDIRKLI